jgi:hypothetical protein
VFSACVQDQIHGHVPGFGHVSGAVPAAQAHRVIVEHPVENPAGADGAGGGH